MKPKLGRPAPGTARRMADMECEIMGMTRDRAHIRADDTGKLSFTLVYAGRDPVPFLANVIGLAELERYWANVPKRKLPTGMERHPWQAIVATIPARIGLGSVDLLACGHKITAHAGPKPETRQCKRCPKVLANAGVSR